jgi:protein gp37/ParB-like chromosome segregation protein Spo0J
MKKTLRELKPHPLNAEIYGDGADAALVQSIKENGVLQPVLIDRSDRILSGHRRCDGANKAGLKEIPVQVFQSEDELDIQAALIEANRQREKSNEQIAREAAHLLKVERERASLRQFKANSKSKVPAKSPEDTGDARDVAGRKLGLGAKKIEQAAVVVETIDRLKHLGDEAGAERVRAELNKYSVNRAFKVARESGYLQGGSGLTPRRAEDHILISQWTQLDEQQKDHHLTNGYTGGQFVSQSADGIEWAKFSWNPITGCARGCKYCYAHDIAARLFPQGFEPSFYPGRLRSPSLTKPPKEAAVDVGYRNVFVSSMGDLFGPWVPEDLVGLVLEAAAAAPEWNFLFLTKYPERLCRFQFPKNAWVGTSIDTQARVEPAERAFEKVTATVKWVSCEPLMERITFSRLGIFNWLVLGGASKTTRTEEFRPPREWVEHLWHQADAAKIKVYEKPNLLERRREYPMQDSPEAVND